MKNPKSLIIKIALGVSAVAFIFSLVTLIRNIVIGSMIFVSVMQLIGAAVIVIICFAMFRIFSGMEDEEELQNDKDDSPQEEEAVSEEVGYDDFDESIPEKTPTDNAESPDEYHLDLFEE